MLAVSFLISLDLIFDPDDGCSTFLRNVHELPADYMGPYPRRLYSSKVNC
jgi:hypothetical protein